VPIAGQNLRRCLGYDLQYFAAIKPQKRLTRMSTRPSAAPSALRRVKEPRHAARYWASGTPRDEETDLMRSNREERNRVFGMPRGPDPHARQGEEQQRVLGIPLLTGSAPLTAIGSSRSYIPSAGANNGCRTAGRTKTRLSARASHPSRRPSTPQRDMRGMTTFRLGAAGAFTKWLPPRRRRVSYAGVTTVRRPRRCRFASPDTVVRH
jgi:hypothetical protein